jgi:O-antigen/teichoic acid export membrane protein
MLRRLGIDSVVYGIATLVVRGLQIFLIPVYTRALGSGDYGVVETVAILGALVNLTVALEISQGMARYIADTPNEGIRRAFASTAVGFAALAYGAFALAVVAFADELTNWFFAGQTPSHTLELAAVAIAVNGVFVIVQDLLRWQLRPRAYLAASLAYAIGSAGVGIWLVAVEGIGVSGVFWGQLTGALLGLVVSLSQSHGLLARLFDEQRLRVMLRYSLPLVLSGAAVFGNLFIDRIVVRELLGTEALGIYGVTARFASVISILAVGLQVALTPLVFRHWREVGTGDALGRICRFYCAAMVPLVGFISLFASEIMGTLTGPAFYLGSKILPLMSLGAMFSTLYVFAPGLFLGERTGRVALLNVAGALVNLILSLTLVSWLGLTGAALATTIAACVVFVGYVFLGRTWFKVNYQAVKVTASLGFVIALVLVGLQWQPEVITWDPLGTALKLALLLLSTLAVYRLGLNNDDREVIWQRISAGSR